MQIYALAAFRSRQSVLRFDSALNEYGITSDIITTPRQISMGCGLSVRFDLAQLALAENLYYSGGYNNLIGFYRLNMDGTRVLISPIL